jgi:hypothetical protein
VAVSSIIKPLEKENTMLSKDRDESVEMVNAILESELISLPGKQLIKAIFKKQQEILIALEDIVRNQEYRNQHTEKRLDELLEKIDPEEAEKRKRNTLTRGEASSGTRVPSRCLI